jgi:hypothetical protein
MKRVSPGEREAHLTRESPASGMGILLWHRKRTESPVRRDVAALVPGVEDCGQLGACGDVEFLEGVGEVRFDRAAGDPEFFGNLAVGEASGGERGDAVLGGGEGRGTGEGVPAGRAPAARSSWWARRARRRMPLSEKKAIVTAPLAALKRRFRNSATSSIGARARRSQAMKATSSPPATARPPMLRAAVQPWLGASMIV